MNSMHNLIIACSYRFPNDVVVVNTTPHAITFDVDGAAVSIQSSVPVGAQTGGLLINAKVQEEPAGKHTVRSVFVPDEKAFDTIDAIKAVFPDAYQNGDLMIVGSIIAANTYHDVVGMCPIPGAERQPPALKRMSYTKFNQGEA